MEHDGHRQRLRERFAKDRLSSFHSHEVLELLLTYAIPRRDTNPLAHKLLDHFGSLHAVFNASVEELTQVSGIGENAATLIALMLPIHKKYEESRLTQKQLLRNSQQLKECCISLFRGIENERIHVLSLNSQLELLGTDLIGEGTPSQVPVFPRAVVSALLRRRATGAVLTHNHPGGRLMPSQQDVDMTETIAQTLSSLDIRLYDHVLVSGEEAFSFRDNGLLLFDSDTDAIPSYAANRQNQLPPHSTKR